ncbi:MAG: GSU2403 family nucleotidyltransferase fold protein [Pseudolabrys sp.]
MQTTYAELLERCAAASFHDQFPNDGSFTKKTVKGRIYWYFQTSSEQGRTQKYVGPETPELLAQIAHHKEARDDERERRALVSALVRSFRLPRPKPEIGNAIEALAKAGAFRLRAVLVGTIAYQTYPAMLGVSLPNPTMQTVDIDIAQFDDTSITVTDRTRSVLEILQETDETFRPVPSLHKGRVTRYVAPKSGLRVEFLTPNVGRETDLPKSLPTLQTDAQPLRFLKFLIDEPDPAVILHGPGILVLVPSPQRYAVHKLIISRRRQAGSIKRDKDILQAEALLDILSKKRPYELGEIWNEAFDTGPKWRKPLAEAMTKIDVTVRDITLKVANKTRSILPGIDLVFHNEPPSHNFTRDVVTFAGKSFGDVVQCEISHEALADYFGATAINPAINIEAFLKNRSAIEQLARTKYLSFPIEEPGRVLIKTMDIPKLRKLGQQS